MPAKAPDIISLKVTIKGIRPPVWRRLLVPANLSLGSLHFVIQAAMGWLGGHMHMFDIGGRQYGDPTLTEEVASEDRLTVGGILRSGLKRFDYTYDFGDNWEHAILIEKKVPAMEGQSYPACIAGKRNCPPEDCGGWPGYEQLLAVLADPNAPDAEDWIDMVEEDFDPEAFSAAKADATLAARFRRR